MPNITQQAYEIYQLKRTKMPRLFPTVTRSEERESKLHEAVEGYLKSLGQRAYWIHARMDQASTIRNSAADYNGWIDGVPFAVELKVRGNKPTPEQQGELRWAANAGARTGVAYSLSEFVAIVTGCNA
jgi:hypothetical protein